MKFVTSKAIVRIATVAALYAALTVIAAPISYVPMQFRISEALGILPLFFPEAVVGLTLGCFIANIFGNGILDLVFGTLATLAAATLTFLVGKIKKKPLKLSLGIVPPIAVNALVVPFTFLALSDLAAAYWLNAGWVALGQSGVLILLGIPFYFAMERFWKLNK